MARLVVKKGHQKTCIATYNGIALCSNKDTILGSVVNTIWKASLINKRERLYTLTSTLLFHASTQKSSQFTIADRMRQFSILSKGQSVHYRLT